MAGVWGMDVQFGAGGGVDKGLELGVDSGVVKP